MVNFNAVTLGTSARANLELSNAGESELVLPTPQVTGPGADAFSIEVNECPRALGAEERCAITLGFEPQVAGEYSATLLVGDTAEIALAGAALTAGSLVFSATDAITPDFGAMTIGESRVQAFTLTNAGGTSESLDALNLSNPREFQILPGPQSCEPSVSRLEMGQSCSVQVQFLPAFAGPKNATLTATGPSGSASLALTGTGLRVAELIGDRIVDFGGAELNTPGSTRIWHVVNVGETSTGALSLSNSNANEFVVAGNCTTLAPGAACDLTVTFNPKEAGYRRTTITLADSAGTQISLDGMGRGQLRLTVATAGPGTVIGTEGAALNCGGNGATCTALVNADVSVTLTATPTNGTSSVLSGWSGADCVAPLTTCRLAISTSTNVTARFTPVSNNLVFVTSENLSASLNGARAYDAVCNQLATAAGINNRAGDEFIAMVSDGATNFLQRLGNARGWVRMDGRPFIDRFTDLIGAGIMYYPARYDERGGDTFHEENRASAVWTGTEPDGVTAFDNCGDWTIDSAQGSARVGSVDHSPALWTGGVNACYSQNPVVCLGRSQTAALVAPRTSGKRIWVTTTGYVPGSMTPDAKCQLERPAGVAQARALVSYTNRAASENLLPIANYVRPDGQLVGTGAQIASLDLITAPWVSAANLPFHATSWLGSYLPTERGTTQSTCNNWTSTSGNAPMGVNLVTSFWSFADFDCNSTELLNLYCVEP